MPPQIKQDLNLSGWETTEFPSVCERCLPENPYVQMLKENHGGECKICTRPFTIFRWKADRTARQKRTVICLTCTRLKNCCQCCMLDLSFGLPIVVRDAALKMVAPGPQGDINREYYAQVHEKEIEENSEIAEAYQKTDEKARELLRRLANSEPYYKRQRRLNIASAADNSQINSDVKLLPSAGERDDKHKPGPIRSNFANSARGARGGLATARRTFPNTTAEQQTQLQDILPPPDPNVTSLFIAGVEDDLPEYELRSFFSQFGTLRSIICSHRSHCAFINYQTRQAAEAAANTCQGKAVIKGCPLRVRWGKPKPLDTMDRAERLTYAREGRAAVGKGVWQASSGVNTGADSTAPY